MKKKLALLLVLVMLFTVFAAGCGGNDDGGEKVVKIGVFEPATGDNGAGGKDVSAFVHDFSANQIDQYRTDH